MATINKTQVDQAQARERDWFLWDDKIPGFGLKVTPVGGKSYVYQYRVARPGEAAKTTPRRYSIGRHGPLTPDQARKRCKELAGLVAQGVDPRQQELDAKAEAERAAEAEANRQRIERDLQFGRIADLWLDHYENDKERRPSSVRQARLVVDGHLRPALVGKSMPEIGRDELEPIVEAIPAAQKAMRRTVHVYANVLWNWAVRRRYAPHNPVLDMEKPAAPKPRDRVLDDVDTLAVWNAAEELASPFRSFVRLLILTGQRRSEVAGMRWEELDRETATWTISADRAKNGSAHIVHLSPQVLAEIERLAKDARDRLKLSGNAWPNTGPALTTIGTAPISGISKAKRALDAAIDKAREKEGAEPIEHWRLHDLRRTVATGLQRLGVRFEVTEAVLNHVSGAKGGVAGVYQRYAWDEEKRTALGAWAEHVTNLGKDGGTSNVIPLADRRSA